MTLTVPRLAAPFPWFGGKSRAADLIWSRFGDTPNYCEPFAGSLAVLLGRPTSGKVETVNDLDGFVANFWRAVAHDPEGVAARADWPVNENDLSARHAYLVARRDTLTRQLEGDPDFYDAKLAGWWAWGACLWIGSGWCAGEGPWRVVDGELVNASGGEFPDDAGRGVNKQLPHLGNGGTGVARPTVDLYEWFEALGERLRRVRVACGDWSRIVTPSVTTQHGLTAVLLDPPYSDTGNETDLYGIAHETGISARVREWAIENGDDPLLRIALCGYEGEHVMPVTWECATWTARRGYGSDENARRERVWFSPHCIRPQSGLFGGLS